MIFSTARGLGVNAPQKSKWATQSTDPYQPSPNA